MTEDITAFELICLDTGDRAEAVGERNAIYAARQLARDAAQIAYGSRATVMFVVDGQTVLTRGGSEL